MRNLKSERLKKLEAELTDLEQWLKLGLVPKKDIPKHKEEIENIRTKIAEETQRLKFLKETGEAEDYVPQKRPAGRGGYSEMPIIPDLDMGENDAVNESRFEATSDTEEMGSESSVISERTDRDESEHEDKTREEDTSAFNEDVDEESYFSERNRWRRGGIIDPDANEW